MGGWAGRKCVCVCVCARACAPTCSVMSDSLHTPTCSVMSDSLPPHGLWPIRPLCPRNLPGKNTVVGCHFLFQEIFPIQGSNLCLLHWHMDSFTTEPPGAILLLCWSLRHVQLFVTPWTVAHQAPLSMRFLRQEYWSGLPFPFPGDLPNPEIKPVSPALACGFFYH